MSLNREALLLNCVVNKNAAGIASGEGDGVSVQYGRGATTGPLVDVPDAVFPANSSERPRHIMLESRGGNLMLERHVLEPAPPDLAASGAEVARYAIRANRNLISRQTWSPSE